MPQEVVEDARQEFSDDERVDAVFGVTIEVLPALQSNERADRAVVLADWR